LLGIGHFYFALTEQKPGVSHEGCWVYTCRELGTGLETRADDADPGLREEL